MDYYTATDSRGVWALFANDGPQVFQYRVQHKRWDEASWWLDQFVGMVNPVERENLTLITKEQLQEFIDNPPKSLVVYSDSEWGV